MAKPDADGPSRDLVLAAHQQLTRDWWQNERGNYQCMISTEVLREAEQGEAEMSRLYTQPGVRMPTCKTSPITFT